MIWFFFLPFFRAISFSSFPTLGVWRIVFSINSALFQPFAFLFLALSLGFLLLFSVYILITLAILRFVPHPNSERVSLHHHPSIIMVIQYHHLFFQQHLHFFLIMVCLFHTTFLLLLYGLVAIILMLKVSRTSDFSKYFANNL